jgi:hypothetical protein
VHLLVADCALPYNPMSMGDLILSSRIHPEDPGSMYLRKRHALGNQKEAATKPLRTSLPLAHAWSIHPRSSKKIKTTEQERDISPKAMRQTDANFR